MRSRGQGWASLLESEEGSLWGLYAYADVIYLFIVAKTREVMLIMILFRNSWEALGCYAGENGTTRFE